MSGLAVIETHPVQYHAPVYQHLQQQLGIPVTAIYGSDFSVAGYKDAEFGVPVTWDTDLLSGYTPIFLSKVSEGGSASPDAVSAKRVGAALHQASPEAVLIVGYSPWFHMASFLQARKGKYPILFRGETTDHSKASLPPKRWVRNLLLRWVYQRCDRLLYVGQQSYRHFKNKGCPEEKLVFSPYCVDAHPFASTETARLKLRQSTRESLQIPADHQVLLFSGKLVPRKGVDVLLRSIKKLPESVRARTTLLLMGDGPLRSAIEREACASPALHLRYVGFKNQTKMSPYYHAADLLILPSQRNETWGLVVNEALLHGLVCIVSDQVGCAPDLIKPGVTGLICEAGSESSLAQAILKAEPLIGHSEIRSQCRQWMAGYSVEKAAEGIATAYRQVVGR